MWFSVKHCAVNSGACGGGWFIGEVLWGGDNVGDRWWLVVVEGVVAVEGEVFVAEWADVGELVGGDNNGGG